MAVAPFNFENDGYNARMDLMVQISKRAVTNKSNGVVEF